MTRQQPPGRRLRPEGQKEKPDRLTRRLLLQLGAAAVLAGLWLGLEGGGGWRGTLTGLVTGSADLWGACETLGEALTQGEDPGQALEDWCVAVFLPAEAADDGR